MARHVQNGVTETRLYVIDDEPVVLRGLELFLSGQRGLEMCGSAEGIVGALEQIAELRPDLVIMDLALKGGDGLELIRELRRRWPGLKVLVFTTNDRPSFVQAAFQAGADGYISKDEGTESVLEAIDVLMSGERFVTPAMAAKLPADWRQYMGWSH